MSDKLAPTRLRKAWSVTVKSYDGAEIFFAATAGRARSMAWRRLDDGQLRIVNVVARRAPYADVHLPVPDEATLALSKQERHCLLHAFGANGSDPTRAGYRDYFYTRRDNPPLVALTALGLMKALPSHSEEYGKGMTYFVLTDAGKRAALSLVPEYAP